MSSLPLLRIVVDTNVVFEGLTRQGDAIQVVPEAEVEQQQQAFQLLIKQLGQASSAEIQSILATREQIEPEADLSSDAVARLQERIQKRA